MALSLNIKYDIISIFALLYEAIASTVAGFGIV